jgi:hypothetical protein
MAPNGFTLSASASKIRMVSMACADVCMRTYQIPRSAGGSASHPPPKSNGTHQLQVDGPYFFLRPKKICNFAAWLEFTETRRQECSGRRRHHQSARRARRMARQSDPNGWPCRRRSELRYRLSRSLGLLCSLSARRRGVARPGVFSSFHGRTRASGTSMRHVVAVGGCGAGRRCDRHC